MIKKPLFFPLQSSAGPSALHILYPRNAKLLQPSNCHLEHTFPCLSCRRLYSELVFRALSLLSFLNPPLGTAPRGSTNSMPSWVQQHPSSRAELICGTHKANPASLQSPTLLGNHLWERNWLFLSIAGEPRNTSSTPLPLRNLQLKLACTHMMGHDKGNALQAP